MLNCGKELAGTCKGGHPAGAYQYVFNHGIPYDTCQVLDMPERSGRGAVVCVTAYGGEALQNCDIFPPVK